MITKITKIVLSMVLLFMSSRAQAYNFLYFSRDNGAVGWVGGTEINYWLDPGSLGQYSNEQLHTLLREAMDIWEQATPLANPPRFVFAGYLPEDINGDNYGDYVSLFRCDTSDLEACPTVAQQNLQTVIIFDEDFSILRNELCRIGGCGASSGPKVFSVDEEGFYENIVQGSAVFGNLNSFSANMVVGILTHELGHLLGLAHTYSNQQLFLENDALTDDERRYLPTMELFMGDPLGGADDRTGSTLNPDDIAGLATLYPSDSFNEMTGTIRGHVYQADGSPLSHVNVIVRNVEDPLCQSYSFITARDCPFTQEICQRDEDLISSYEINGLPPGTYTVEVETVLDESLARVVAPGLIIDPTLSGPAEFWNESDQADEDSSLQDTITVVANQSIDDIDIILAAYQDDVLQLIPLDAIPTTLNSSCQSSSVDYQEMVFPGSTRRGSGGCSLVLRK